MCVLALCCYVCLCVLQVVLLLLCLCAAVLLCCCASVLLCCCVCLGAVCVCLGAVCVCLGAVCVCRCFCLCDSLSGTACLFINDLDRGACFVIEYA